MLLKLGQGFGLNPNRIKCAQVQNIKREGRVIFRLLIVLDDGSQHIFKDYYQKQQALQELKRIVENVNNY
jgi:hypothetical protein